MLVSKRVLHDETCGFHMITAANYFDRCMVDVVGLYFKKLSDNKIWNKFLNKLTNFPLKVLTCGETKTRFYEHFLSAFTDINHNHNYNKIVKSD